MKSKTRRKSHHIYAMPWHTIPYRTIHIHAPPNRTTFFSRRRVAALPQLAAYKIGCDPIIYAGICSIRWPLFWDGFGGLGRHRCKKGRERVSRKRGGIRAQDTNSAE